MIGHDGAGASTRMGYNRERVSDRMLWGSGNEANDGIGQGRGNKVDDGLQWDRVGATN